MAKIIDPDDLTLASEKDKLGDDGNVWIDTATRQVYLAKYDNLTDDGVTLQCLYSFLKEEWKNDNSLIKYPFPMTAITPEEFEFVNGWKVAEDDEDVSRYLLRDGGYAVKKSDGTNERAFFGCITLGNFDDPSSDRAYYWIDKNSTDTIDTHYAGAVNETIEYFRDKTLTGELLGTGDGSNKVFNTKWYPITADSYKVYVAGDEKTEGDDYTIDLKTGKIEFKDAVADGDDVTADYTSSFDYSDFFKIFLRIEGKKYSQSELSDIGVEKLTYQAYRFPLSNEIDLKITHTDDDIDSDGDGYPDKAPYKDMDIKFLAGDGFTDYDSDTTYNVNYVVKDDNGRWYISQTDDNKGNKPSDDDGTNWKSYDGERQVGSEYYAFNKFIDANTGDGDNPRLEQIYELAQFALRQNLDIDSGDGVVIGKVTSPLVEFVGDELVTNKGVYIDHFNDLDINRLEFHDVFDNKRNFPYVASGIIYFNESLQADDDAVFAMFFKDPDNDENGNEFGTDGAIIVQDKDGNDIAGAISNKASITFTFDYDGNTQGGRDAGTDAEVVVVAIGLDKAQYVRAEGVITRSTSNSISLVSSLERNYINP